MTLLDTPGTRAAGTADERPDGGRQRAPGRRAGAAWLSGAAVAAAVLMASGSLNGVFEGWRWLEHATVTVVAVCAAAAGVRALGARSPWPTLAALTALVCTLTLQFFSESAFLGFLPGPETVRRLLEVFPAANQAILSEAPPVLPGAPLVFLTCLAVGLVAATTDLIAFGLRFPAFAAVPLGIVLAAASLIKPQGAGLGHVAATAVGFLLILGAARLADSTIDPAAAVHSGLLRQSVLIAAGAVIAMLVVPLALPGFTTGLLPEGRKLYLWGQPTGINPVLNLGNNLRSPVGLTTVRYWTDSEEPLYLRTAVVGDLDAARWAPGDADVSRQPMDGSLDQGPWAAFEGETTIVNTRIATGNYASPWLPLPTGAGAVDGLRGTWGWFPETATALAGAGAASPDQDYRVVSRRPVITAELLAGSGRPAEGGPPVPEVYSSVPDELPGIVVETAERVVAEASAGNDYERALALQNHLRGVDYRYSEETPLEQGYDGNGLAVVEAFLEVRSGYCIHYSSAMALMARSLGIPSRIAIGYAPGREAGGTVDGPDGTQLQGYSITSRNAHAWPELYFEGIGWVPFEPTPGRGTTPGYAPDAPGPAEGPVEDPLLPAPGQNTADPGAEPTSEASSPAATPGGGRGSGDGPGTAPTIGGAVLLLLLLASPHLLRRLAGARRLRRVRAMDAPGAGPEARSDGPAAAWDELVALGLDYGHRMRAAETATDYANRLTGTLPDAAGSLAVLREAFERVRYAPPGHGRVPEGTHRHVPEPRPDGGSLATRLAGARPVPTAQPGGAELAAALREVELEFSAAAGAAAQARARGLPPSLFAR
ncbi:transglutaminase TgpA family protein [Zafaria sp. Z1313]|uniref:transglutaminase TgpA family protein n=1 Tax=Zafaria sp. Z1313 TaxID=3423202 RepID=UPI003D302BDB